MEYKIEDRHLKDPKKRGKLTIAFCDFHDDKNTPNLTVYENRNGYKCYVCGAHGNAYDYLEKTGQLPPKEKSVVQIKMKDVKKAHENLLENEAMLKTLKDKRLWEIKIIKELRIGLKGHYITFPILSKNNLVLNIRLYDPLWTKEKKTAKIMSWAKGLGTRVDPFPATALNKDEIVLLEGEPDTTLARQMGFNAATFTAGAEGIKDKHLNTLVNKSVIVIFDIDDKGKRAAKRITRYLVHICKSVKNIALPITKPSNGDLTDYFRQGHTKEDLLNLIKETPACVLSIKARDKIMKMKPEKMHLADAAIAINTAKKQEILVIVTGKDLVPYLIPRKISVFCSSGSRNSQCALCGLADTDTKEITIGPYDPEILSIIGCTENYARGIYRQMVNIPKRCVSWSCDVIEHQNVEDVTLNPDITEDDNMWRPYVSRQAYIVDNIVDANRSYKMTGWTTAHPNTHHVAHIIETAEPLQSTLENFKMTDGIKKNLKIFIPVEKQTVIEKINEIHSDLSENVTNIWGRNDMLWLIDLAFHSVLQFRFMDILTTRGWVEVLLLGDTRCGKTRSVVNILSHYHAGELVGAENLSFAGLVGGIQSIGNRNMITWGKLPLNDGKLVAIDEFSGMPKEDIARLSGIRSSGIAEITKIQTEKTRSRVRLIVMSNPLRGIGLNNYAMGIYALKELIEHPEDIARFDLVLTMAADEVKPEQINKRTRNKIEHVYTSNACSDRIRWAWSRKPENIIFTNDAVDLILTKTIEQSKKYHSSIPLVEPSEQRIKIARLSIATAIMSCSIVNDENVLVTDEHVDATLKIMEYTYKKSSMAYDHYSDGRYRENELVNEMEVKEKIVKLGSVAVITLLDKIQIQLMDMEDLCGKREEAKLLLSFLVRNRALNKPWSAYRKTPPFTKLLIKIKKEMDEIGSSYFDGTEEESEPSEEQQKIPF